MSTPDSTIRSRRRFLRHGTLVGAGLVAGCTELFGGKRGTLSVALTPFDLGEQIPWEDFDTLGVRLEKCVLNSPADDSVTIEPSEQMLDLTTLDRTDSVTVVDSRSVPRGEYRSMEFYLPVVTATKTDGTAVEFDGVHPLSMATGALGQYLVIDSDPVTVTLAVGPSERDDEWTLAASLGVPP